MTAIITREVNLKAILLLLLCMIIASCKNESNPKVHKFAITELDAPCKKGGEPNLFSDENGKIFLTWVEYLNDTTDALMFSSLDNSNWSTPKMISSGSDWFVNWADFPSLVAYPQSNTLAAHWLQKSDVGTFDYDVRIAQSRDSGESWDPSFIPHKDGIAAEHGFVSMVPIDSNRVFATWLDGRNTKSKDSNDNKHDHDHSGHHGAMTLRGAFFDPQGNLSGEIELDQKICDCCQTAAVKTNDGILVAYRDRSDKEIRDISYVRYTNNTWTAPQTLHNDQWKIAGCPVNGPALDALDDAVLAAWYTMDGETPIIKYSFSDNNGASFGKTEILQSGNTLGRIDAILTSDNDGYVSYINHKDENAKIMLHKVSSSGHNSSPIAISEIDPSRQSGFPRMTLSGNKIIMAWTHVAEGSTTIKTVEISLH